MESVRRKAAIEALELAKGKVVDAYKLLKGVHLNFEYAEERLIGVRGGLASLNVKLDKLIRKEEDGNV